MIASLYHVGFAPNAISVAHSLNSRIATNLWDAGFCATVTMLRRKDRNQKRKIKIARSVLVCSMAVAMWMGVHESSVFMAVRVNKARSLEKLVIAEYLARSARRNNTAGFHDVAHVSDILDDIEIVSGRHHGLVPVCIVR